MTDPILTWLLARKWVEISDQFNPHARSFFAPVTDPLRKRGMTNCECNSKPPGLRVIIYPPWRADCISTYDVELCGLQGGIWLKYEAYSLASLEEVRKGIAAVTKAWKAGKK